MNLSSFDYFVALAQEGSFTKAAQRLYITQQSLSSQIASLERELGCQLVVRRIPLELTYAGHVFLKYALAMQQQMLNLRREFCDITQNQKGILRVGIAFTRGRALMPGLIAQFQAQYPNIEVQLVEAANKTLYHNLLNGQADLAIANFTAAAPEVELCDFYCEQVVLLAENNLLKRTVSLNTAALRKQLECGDLSALHSCPFVLGTFDNIAGKIGRSLIEAAGFSPVVKAKSGNVETLLALCAQGIGACFCPQNLVGAALSASKLKQMQMFCLGSQAKYAIRFGFLRTNYQWKVIEQFIDIAKRCTDL